MNIETANPKITSTTSNSVASPTTRSGRDDSARFSEELTALSQKESVEEKPETKLQEEAKDASKSENNEETEGVNNEPETLISTEEKTEDRDALQEGEKEPNSKPNADAEPEIDKIIDGLQNTFEEMNKVKNPDTVDHSDENFMNPIKNPKPDSDKNKNDEEDNILINNDMNIQDPKEPLMPQMNSGMNFDTNGQPFREFINNQPQELSLSEQDLEEESAILSTMSENLAIASKNMLLNKNNEKKDVKKAESVIMEQTPSDTLQQEDIITQPKVKTVTNEQGIKKVDTKTNVTVETVVKYDNIIMNKGDVEFFTKLVENGSVDMNSVHQSTKSSQVSKSLADMLAKSMQDNQPVRIDFDNNISVIIKVSKQGKISADFLPSSQVAEAYLKENLPLLKQRFDDNNIEYDELNQRKQRQDEKEDRKKGRKDE